MNARISTVEAAEIDIEAIHRHLKHNSDSVFAVLDSCDEPRVPEKVKELKDRAVSLYRGEAARDFWAFAPYIAQVDTELLNWIHENLWTDPWGFIAFARVDLADLRRHFRKFLTVKDPEGELAYFRFYDPRVLPVFLETATAEQTKEFFGPVQTFCVSSDDGSAVAIEPRK